MGKLPSTNFMEKFSDIKSSGMRQAQEEVKPDQFEILRVLGQGSFGKIFLVRKKTSYDSGNLYAMKVFNKGVLKPRDLQRTNTERNILTKIHHPFIVQLCYAFQTKSKLYLVMDFLQGGDLFSRLSGEITFREDVAKFYLAELALALEHLHCLGIVHRDLKPENILLDTDGHIRLTDFGLSKEFEVSEDKTFSYCGTIEYMAPEVVGRRGHSAVADWWSFGVLMYQMLIGRLPFLSHDDNHHHTIKLIVKGKCLLPQYLSPKAHNLLRGLLQCDPHKRFGAGPLGSKKIQGHRFFSTINWQRLLHRKITPPFKPIFSPTDDIVRYFDVEFTRKKPADSPGIPSSHSYQELFKNFDFTSADIANIKESHCSNDISFSLVSCEASRL